MITNKISITKETFNCLISKAKSEERSLNDVIQHYLSAVTDTEARLFNVPKDNTEYQIYIYIGKLMKNSTTEKHKLLEYIKNYK